MNRILIVDEHEVARRGIRDLVRARPRMEVVAEVGTGQEALTQSRELSPHIVITGYSLPDITGSELVRRLREIVPGVKVLVFTTQRSERILLESMNQGARGVVLKTDPAGELLSALDSVALGRIHLSSGFPDAIRSKDWPARSQNLLGPITSRELEVMELIARGKHNRQIAELLTLSIKTVESHRASLMHKFELRTAADVVRCALRNDILAA